VRDPRVVAITGAGSGIGLATALEASHQGFAILAISLERAQLNELGAQIARDGGTCITLPLDVTAVDTPARILRAAREHYGRIDVIVHCAGAATAGALLEQSDAQIDAQWQLHVAAPLRITRTVLPMLKESHGQVMLIGSGLSRVPPPYYGAYCAAKAAVRTVATQLRRELRPSGIAVTFVDPGSVRTNFGKDAGFDSAYDPDWTLAEPDHVAKRIVRAIHTRPPILNAVPLHTMAATLGEWFPRFTDRALSGRTPPAPRLVTEPPSAVADPAPSEIPELSDFERALEPVSRRMERVKLPATFLADLLRPGENVQLADAAMRWAGMPNKNERAALTEALDALAAGGFLEKTGDERWRVLRSAD
jgi:short-subunit dehydrogenase